MIHDSLAGKMREEEFSRIARQLRLLCLDVDGVLTDGAMYYDAKGEALKRFHTRDAAGIALLRKTGIDVAWLTAEDSAITAARARKLQIAHLILDCADKLAAADCLRKQLQLEWSQIGYMGDDWFDLPLLQQVGLSACPADAHPEVQSIVTFCSTLPGGNGAVRELCDLVLKAQEAGGDD